MTTTTSIKPNSIYRPGNLYQVPPGGLLLQRNIRDTAPDAGLIASVREIGVLEPITAVLTETGGLLVRFGHRRTLAAVEAQRDTVPVYVADVDDPADQAEIERVIAQHDENTQRTGLTAADEVGVVEQLVAFGLSSDEISAQARIHQDRVDTALTVSRSKLASKTAAKYEQLTLEQVAAIAEFDDDAEAVKALTVCAIERPAQFAHTLQRARDDRARAIAHAAAVKELEDAGVKVIDPPDYGSKVKSLDYLVDATTGKDVTTKGHKKCPGHVAWVRYGRTEYGCTNPAKNGHADRYGSSSKPAAADMTDAEREKAKTARRLVIDNNKAWDSAQVVRREWITEFAKRKTPPNGTAAFIAGALSADRYILTHEGNQTTREKLCTEWGLPMKKHGYGHRVDVPASTTENRALMIALVQVLAAHESSVDRMDWRRDGKTERHGRYLRFLESAGYALSDVEKYAVSSKTP